jgi:hypothetical protein
MLSQRKVTYLSQFEDRIDSVYYLHHSAHHFSYVSCSKEPHTFDRYEPLQQERRMIVRKQNGEREEASYPPPSPHIMFHSPFQSCCFISKITRGESTSVCKDFTSWIGFVRCEVSQLWAIHFRIQAEEMRRNRRKDRKRRWRKGENEGKQERE